MDSSEQVGGALYTLTGDALIDVWDFLTIAGSQFEVSGKSRSISNFIGHLERELGELEDQGMTELLILKDTIVELQMAAQNSEPQQLDSDAKQKDLVQEHVVQPSETERLQKEIETLKLALALSLLEKPNQTSGATKLVSGDGNSAKQDNVSDQQTTPTNLVSHYTGAENSKYRPRLVSKGKRTT